MQKDKFILRQAAVPCDVGMQRSACDCILSRYVRRNVAIKSVSEIVTILQFIDKLGTVTHRRKSWFYATLVILYGSSLYIVQLLKVS